MTTDTHNTVTVWTVTGNNDGEVWTLVYADFEQVKAMIWSDVVDAAERHGIDLGDGLGTDEFGGELDKNSVGDWCRFIETNGWKCRMYEYDEHTLTLPTTKAGE
ncbi:hypothetical protein GCM10022234_00350 [Aeromicrobium panaciterrae]|uniref:hypothetical protein n=1 Tax=Aeromicrobium panaciterrae TaxID=363861 RepID=UPI0031DFFA77